MLVLFLGDRTGHEAPYRIVSVLRMTFDELRISSRPRRLALLETSARHQWATLLMMLAT
jgi:hypothetical protein